MPKRDRPCVKWPLSKDPNAITTTSLSLIDDFFSSVPTDQLSPLILFLCYAISTVPVPLHAVTLSTDHEVSFDFVPAETKVLTTNSEICLAATAAATPLDGKPLQAGPSNHDLNAIAHRKVPSPSASDKPTTQRETYGPTAATLPRKTHTLCAIVATSSVPQVRRMFRELVASLMGSLHDNSIARHVVAPGDGETQLQVTCKDRTASEFEPGMPLSGETLVDPLSHLGFYPVHVLQTQRLRDPNDPSSQPNKSFIVIDLSQEVIDRHDDQYITSSQCNQALVSKQRRHQEPILCSPFEGVRPPEIDLVTVDSVPQGNPNSGMSTVSSDPAGRNEENQKGINCSANSPKFRAE